MQNILHQLHAHQLHLPYIHIPRQSSFLLRVTYATYSLQVVVAVTMAPFAPPSLPSSQHIASQFRPQYVQIDGNSSLSLSEQDNALYIIEKDCIACRCTKSNTTLADDYTFILLSSCAASSLIGADEQLTLMAVHGHPAYRKSARAIWVSSHKSIIISSEHHHIESRIITYTCAIKEGMCIKDDDDNGLFVVMAGRHESYLGRMASTNTSNNGGDVNNMMSSGRRMVMMMAHEHRHVPNGAS